MGSDVGRFALRRAGVADAAVVVGFVRLMVAEMEGMGGHAAARGEESWSKIERAAPERLESDDRIYLLAELDSVPVGFGEASSVSVIPVFEPKVILHINSLYITPEHRAKGFGKRIFRGLLNWGRSQGCAEIELNVLVGNPARKLYSDLGFSDFELKMVRKL